MLPLLLFSVLAAGEPTRVLVLDVRVDGASETTGRVIRDEIAQGLAGDPRLEALSSEDLRRVVSLEAERRVLGCVDDSCIAEVGQALGARYVVHGSLSVVGALRILRVNVLDTDANRSVLRETVEARSDEDLLPQLRSAVARVRARLLDEAVPSPPSSPAAPFSALQTGGIVGLGLGAAAVVGGGIAMAVAWPTFTDAKADFDKRGDARTVGQVGTVLLGGGVIVGVVGTALFVVGGAP